MAGKSLAEEVALLTEEERAEVFKDYTEEDWDRLQYDWGFWGRPDQTPPEGQWHIFLALAGRGWGKAENIDTPIPTPYGWVRMGDIVAGDYVFDENGEPAKVLQAFDPFIPETMYKVSFSDGTSVECGEEHLWTTWDRSARKSFNRRNTYNVEDESVGLPENWPEWKKADRYGNIRPEASGPKTRNTRELFNTLREGSRGDLNHSIPVVSAPVQYPERSLFVDPYVYGAWLGDGTTRDSTIASHTDESQWMAAEIRSRGYEVTMREAGGNCKLLNVKGLMSGLRIIGTLGTKAIDPVYLISSEQQRRDFLAGLLDTDGYVNPENQQIEFCAKRKEHAEAVVELARSFGQKPVMFEGRATLNGVDHGIKYRVKWRPTENFFYMPRKAAVFQPLGAQASRAMHRMITNIEEIPPVMSRCIAVDSPNHLFLCGEGMIPTHNSRSGAEWIREKAKEPNKKILLLGRTASDVRDVMVAAILEVYPPEERPIYIPSKRRIEWANGTFALCASSESPDQLRGPQAHVAWVDEMAALKTIVDDSGANAWTNLLTCVRLGDNPQIFATTTPKRTQMMKDIVADAELPEKRIEIITGSTFDNATLSTLYIDSMVSQYGNSDLAKQELYGQMLGESAGILFNDKMIEDATITRDEIPQLALRFIAVDPSVAERPRDECGIIAIGVSPERDLEKRTAYVLEDYSLRGSPEVWAQRVVDAAKEQRTKFIIVEGNQGKQLLQMVLNSIDPSLRIFLVNASTGKYKRAEPVAIALSQKRVRIVDNLPDLTDQMVFFDPEDIKTSPDRMDAMVHGVVAAIITPPEGLRAPRYQATSAVNRKLPTTNRSARQRVTGSIRRRR